MPITLHSFRRKDPSTNRWRVLRWKMDNDQAKEWAAKEGAEIEKVPGSEEVRIPVSGHGAVRGRGQRARSEGREQNAGQRIDLNQYLQEIILKVRQDQ